MTDTYTEEIKHSVFVAESRMRTVAHSVADTAQRARGFAEELREGLAANPDGEAAMFMRIAIGQFELIAEWNEADADRLKKEGRV
jgi:hypothetical protein